MKNRLIFISLVVVFAISVGLVGCVPPEEEPLEFMIYKVNPVTVLPEYVQDLASTLFALNITPTLNETSEVAFAWFDTLYVECCKDSGSIWFADLSKLYNEEYIPQELPSAEDARARADEFLGFLHEQGLIPELETEFLVVFETRTATLDIATSETEVVTNHLDVTYGFVHEFSWGQTITTAQPYEKIRVSVGDKGEIIGFHYVHPELRIFEDYPAITEEEALEILRERLGREPEELEVELGYYGESEFTKQDFVQPYYIFDGTVMIEEEEVPFKTQLIPATTFSPTARIVSPDNYAEFPEGTIIDFEASVSGGEPPYEYIWGSDIDGVIGTEASISSALSVGTRDGEILPHTIKLKVIDQNGSQAIDIISVKVTPSAPMVSAPEEFERIQTLSTGSPRDDDTDKELLIEWVNDYGPNFLSPLHFEDENAKGFRDELLNDGWDTHELPGWYADEEDFKFLGGPEGGKDFLYIDAVDFAYFSGHGCYRCISFASTMDYRAFSFENARWGGDAGGTPGEEGDLEWIVLDACLTLAWCERTWGGGEFYIFDRWDQQAFDGLHYVLGFNSVTGSSRGRGKIFAQYMKEGWTVRMAWIRATQATSMPDKCGAYLRAESLDPMTDTYRDHLPDHGYVSRDPYPVDLLVYYTWSCG